jgi:hypothetical protein
MQAVLWSRPTARSVGTALAHRARDRGPASGRICDLVLGHGRPPVWRLRFRASGDRALALCRPGWNWTASWLRGAGNVCRPTATAGARYRILPTIGAQRPHRRICLCFTTSPRNLAIHCPCRSTFFQMPHKWSLNDHASWLGRPVVRRQAAALRGGRDLCAERFDGRRRNGESRRRQIAANS